MRRPSFFCTFDCVELTLHSEMKRKTGFSFAFHSFFRNFANENQSKRQNGGNDDYTPDAIRYAGHWSNGAANGHFGNGTAQQAETARTGQALAV